MVTNEISKACDPGRRKMKRKAAASTGKKIFMRKAAAPTGKKMKRKAAAILRQKH